MVSASLKYSISLDKEDLRVIFGIDLSLLHFELRKHSCNDHRLVITNDHLFRICGTSNLSDFIKNQQRKFLAHIIRIEQENKNVKKLTFNSDKYTKRGRPAKTLLDIVTGDLNTSVDAFCTMALHKKF